MGEVDSYIPRDQVSVDYNEKSSNTSARNEIFVLSQMRSCCGFYCLFDAWVVS